MKRIVTAAQMKDLDNSTIRYHKISQMVLMERAALSVVRHLESYDLCRTLVICGSGNNGGDGIAVARILHMRGVSVDVYFAGNPQKKSTGCKEQSEIAETYGVRWVNNPQYSEYTTIVDALFGVGISREITGNYARIIQAVNDAGVPVVAVDIPSGICADTGKVMGCAIYADRTVTFAYAKVGQLYGDGRQYCGTLAVEDIGIYETKTVTEEEKDTNYYGIVAADLKKIPIRLAQGNKGTFGKVLLIAGSEDMPGASVLCGQAILRTGAGMLKIVVPKENRQILTAALPEAMIAAYDSEETALEQIEKGLRWADVAVLGPGIGMSKLAEAMTAYVMKNCSLPLVLDADGLNIISQNLEWLRQRSCPCILTPHMGELARLLGQSVSKTKEDFFEKIQDFSEQYQVQCVCKDAVTCTVMPRRRIYINQTGNCGMATAGSGDVLTGMIGGLLAVGTPMAYAGPLGAYLHGACGDRIKEEKGAAHLIAGDLIRELAAFRIGEERGKDYELIQPNQCGD